MSWPFKKLALFISFVFLLFFILFVVAQTAQVVELAGRVHPVFGQFVLWTLLGVYLIVLAVPVALALGLRKPLQRPLAESGPEFDRYVEQLAGRLRDNPELKGVDLAPESSATRTAEVRKALDVLGGRADGVIRDTASIVFVSTAISQSGRLDGLAVLVTQVQMVWKIAHIYNQRPSFREMFHIYREVTLTSFVAFELDDVLDTVEERIAPIIHEMLGTSIASAVPGASVAASMLMACLVDGSSNAFLTLRIGIITKRYCGALSVTERRVLRRSATRDALGMLGGIVASVGGQIVARVGKKGWNLVGETVSKASTAVLETGKSAVRCVADAASSAGTAVKNTFSAGLRKVGVGRGES